VTPRARVAIALGLVMASVIAIHHGSLTASFFADDYLFLDQVRDHSLFHVLRSPDPIGNFLRPISRQVWFWALAGASHESTTVFHVANLALFLGILVLLFRIASRLLPRHAALAGVAMVAVHHAADVPLVWACGSQDLLAVLGSLAAFELHASGRRWWAALAMLLALLSKETVILAPLVAVALSKRQEESWSATLRRGWMQLAVLPTWLAAWIATTKLRPAVAIEVRIEPAGAPSALVHLVQTATGIELPLRGAAFHAPPPPAIVPALLGIALLVAGARARVSTSAPEKRKAAARPARGSTRDAARGGAPPGRSPDKRATSPARLWFVMLAGGLWALLGAIPVAAVAQLWSAYYYLFSLCGLALVVGACVARLPWWAALVPALIVGTTSENARSLPEFAIARDPWSTESHLNRRYFVRGMTLAGEILDQLMHLRPSLPRSSTLYFSGLPHSIAFQAGNGPLVRWAYRDSSLRSYYFTRFELWHARRGPLFFFNYRRDTLVEITGADSLERVGLSLLYDDVPAPARDLLTLAWERDPSIATAYRLAWVEMGLHGVEAARPWLARARAVPDPGPTPEIPVAYAHVARGDTASAIALMAGAVWEHALDPGAHALMADLLLATGEMELGAVEAYATRALAPEDPMAWRRWGLVEAFASRDLESVRALERYLALAKIRADRDPEVANALRMLRRRIPGGDVAQAELGRL